MARLQPGGNHGQAMGALSFCSGPDASLAAATPARFASACLTSFGAMLGERPIPTFGGLNALSTAEI